MKNDWTDLIREEILDIPSALSDDDWDSFQAKYAAALRRKKTAVTAWSGAVAAAAAVVIGVISADLRKDDTISVITPHVIEATAEGSAADIDMLVNKEKIDAAPEIHLPAKSAIKAGKDINTVEEEVAPVMTDQGVTASEAEDVADKTDGKQRTPDREERRGIGKEWDIPQSGKPEPRHHRVTLAMAGNINGYAMGGNRIQGGNGVGTMANTPDQYFSQYGYGAEIHPVRHAPTRKVSYEHLLPVEIGISVRYYLGKHSALQSGINWSMLRSRATTTMASRTLDESEQRLDLIGLPLEAVWASGNRDGLSLYAGVGGMVEMCVHGVRGGNKLEREGLQWSVNANAGLQYDFNRTVGIYFEPRVRYYLTATGVPTWRTDNRMDLSASVGLRFNL